MRIYRFQRSQGERIEFTLDKENNCVDVDFISADRTSITDFPILGYTELDSFIDALREMLYKMEKPEK